jgi:hypothetical protein
LSFHKPWQEPESKAILNDPESTLSKQPLKMIAPNTTIVPNLQPEYFSPPQNIVEKSPHLIAHFRCALSMTYIQTTVSISIFLKC